MTGFPKVSMQCPRDRLRAPSSRGYEPVAGEASRG